MSAIKHFHYREVLLYHIFQFSKVYLILRRKKKDRIETNKIFSKSFTTSRLTCQINKEKRGVLYILSEIFVRKRAKY